MDVSKNIKILAWHEFWVSFVLWGPIAILYFAQVTGSYAKGLSVFSVVTLACALFEVPTGLVSDMVGRRKTLIFGAISYVIGFILYAIGGSYLVLLVGAVFEGLARSFYSGNNQALLYDSTVAVGKNDELSSYLGKMGSMGQWALAVAGLLGGVVASWSFQWVMWISVLPQLICLWLAIQIVEVKEVSKVDDNAFRHLDKAIRNFVINRKLRWLSTADMLGFGLGEASFQFRAAFVATLWPVWAIGMAGVLSNIGAAVSFKFSGQLINKFRATVWLFVGGLYSKIIYLVALFLPTLISPALMASTSLFYGVGQVAKSTLMQREFSDKQRATMGSLNSFGGSILFALFAVILGWVADVTSPKTALIGVTIVQFINVVIYGLLVREEKCEYEMINVV